MSFTIPFSFIKPSLDEPSLILNITVSNNDTFTLGELSTVSRKINWGDGTIDITSSASPSHTYVASGNYSINIYNFGYVYSSTGIIATTSKTKLKSVASWGDCSALTTMRNMFYNCSALTSIPSTWGDFSSLLYMTAMFSGCSSLATIPTTWSGLESVIAINSLFSNCTSLTYIPTSNPSALANITTAGDAFGGCSSVTSDILSLYNYLSSKAITVTNYSGMFYGCTSASGYSSIPSTWGGGNYNGNDSYTKYLYHGNTLTNVAYAAPSSTSLSQVGTNTSYNNSTKKFSEYGSLYNTYYTSYFSAPITSTNFSINSNFTIDFWFRHETTYNVSREIFVLYNGSTGEALKILSSSTTVYLYGQNSSGTTVLNSSSTSTVAKATFYHFAIVRNGTSTKLYLNGTAIISATSQKLRTDHTIAALIQGAGYETNNYLRMCEFRISSTARWTANFTPPTAPYGY